MMFTFDQRVCRTATRSVAVLFFVLSPGVVFAQAPDRPVFVHGNVGVPFPQTGDFSQSASVPFSDEVLSHESHYQTPSGVFLDGGGGWLFSRRFGAGLSFSRSGGSGAASFSMTRPHPYFYNSSLTKIGTSPGLGQVQRSVHISAVMTPDFGRDYDLMLFAGPSRIYVDQELITGVDISETIQGEAYDFAINRPVISDGKVCACAWGFHVGADASRFLTERFGIGGMIRYSRAKVDLQNAASIAIGGDAGSVEFTAGGLTIAGGLRLRLALKGLK
jgi:hypothetical protein